MTASVPRLDHGDGFTQTDYFGDVSPSIQPEIALPGTASVPALPRRVC